MPERIIKRRDFVRKTAAASLALGLGAGRSVLFGRCEQKPVRLGFVGVGSRGTGLLRVALQLDGVEIPAVCDINQQHLARARHLVERKGKNKPDGYSRGPEDFRRMVQREDLDAVVTATPWEWHAPVMVAAMKAGKYGATEIPATMRLDQCWQLVETSESTGMPCMLLENVCYYRNVLAVLNMVQQGMFGELVHCEAGYQHDTRYVKIGPRGELLWRARYPLDHTGNFYPTHPMGPVSWWSGINRGDRFSYLVSMSTKSAGINHYVREKFGPDHQNAKRKYTAGDINTTLIRTENGLTVTLYYDTCLPRPYDLIFRLQGTQGIYMGTLNKIYLEHRSPQPHTWEDADPYFQQYEHPLWKQHGETARDFGHSGGDYLVMQQFVHAVRHRIQTPIDVYDAATWSAIVPLTEQSVAGKSRPVDFPDFTRGRWKTARQIEFYGI
jgi:predicted dehydrogenase